MVLPSENYLLLCQTRWDSELLIASNRNSKQSKGESGHVRKSPVVQLIQVWLDPGAQQCQQASAPLRLPFLPSVGFTLRQAFSMWSPRWFLAAPSFWPSSSAVLERREHLFSWEDQHSSRAASPWASLITCFPWTNHIGLRDGELQVKIRHLLLVPERSLPRRGRGHQSYRKAKEKSMVSTDLTLIICHTIMTRDRNTFSILQSRVEGQPLL